MAEKGHYNIVFIGHVDHGKSTLVGRMMYDSGMLPETEYRKLKEEAESRGKGSFAFAYLMDNLKEERERGVTIDVNYKKLVTPHRNITIIDAPGHRDFIKNMIKGTSQADAAVLVVAAPEGVQLQTKEHAFIAQVMGIKKIIIAVNKMDVVNYDEKKYKEVSEAAKKLLIGSGFKDDAITLIPLSAWIGDNVVKKSDKMAWYTGKPLIELLDIIELPSLPTDKPLRLPIEDVYNIKGIGLVPVGRVEAGIMRPNDKVVVMPGNKPAEVRSIESHHQALTEAKPGDNIGFSVRGWTKEDMSKGDVVGFANSPPTVVKEFTAQIVVLQHPTAIAAGYTPVFHIHTLQQSCTVTELVKKLDPKTGATLEENPKFLKAGDAAIVKVKPLKPICVEKFKDFPALGRFAIRDMGQTVAAGVIIDLVKN
ncbi:MAG: translation elongation factor EF-1 subunit alpha [Candidatus Diapherotrites archaeon CG08_land_8_20_14_0_20_30_16]|nr:MAG: translation elongation factor EF-1 subunit alpha [Candidatus Diapherotrites archaeon CG08_land_8_20_14_0_20_30_16]